MMYLYIHTKDKTYLHKIESIKDALPYMRKSHSCGIMAGETIKDIAKVYTSYAPFELVYNKKDLDKYLLESERKE